MTLKELLDIANFGYPDGYLSEYYDGDGKPKQGTGDTLANFVVLELSETFDQTQDTATQLGVAIHVLENAVQELQDTIASLETELLKHNS